MGQPHPIEKLKDLQLKKLTKPGFVADGKGLYFKIDPTGSRSWVFRYMIDGNRRMMGLGSYPDVSLSKARKDSVSGVNYLGRSATTMMAG